MTVRVRVICDFCRRESPTYSSTPRATADLLDNQGWTLMVIDRKQRHRCGQCTKVNKTDPVKVVP